MHMLILFDDFITSTMLANQDVYFNFVIKLMH